MIYFSSLYCVSVVVCLSVAAMSFEGWHSTGHMSQLVCFLFGGFDYCQFFYYSEYVSFLFHSFAEFWGSVIENGIAELGIY